VENKRLAIIADGGGVGKTTITINIAYVAYQKGKSVAILDLDNNLSINNFTGVDKVPKSQSILQIFEDDFNGDWNLVSLFESDYKVALVPGSEYLSSEILTNKRRKENLLKRRLLEYPLPYDLIIFDNRGGSDALVDNSIVAATDILIPTRVGAKTATISETIVKIAKSVRELELNPAPRILGVVPNEKEQTRSVHEQIIKGAKKSLKTQGIKMYPDIPHNGWICNSNSWQIPIAAHRPRDSYIEVFKEIVEDIFNES
jgi:chromosome partitioning protein